MAISANIGFMLSGMSNPMAFHVPASSRFLYSCLNNRQADARAEPNTYQLTVFNILLILTLMLKHSKA